jgi:hypothetical protein
MEDDITGKISTVRQQFNSQRRSRGITVIYFAPIGCANQLT